MVSAKVVRWGLRLVNTALAVLCCFLVARTANAIFEALLRPPLEPANRSPAEQPEARSPRNYQIILTRNLFDASPLAAAAPPPGQPVEESELPLGLLGTISSPDSEDGSASLWDAESNESLVVTPGDAVAGGLATVVAVERRRVLLSENGAVRELVLGDDEYQPPKPVRARPKKRPRARGRRRGRR